MVRRGEIPRRELWFLAGAIGLGLAVRVAFVLITADHTLQGDEIEYDIEGRFIAEGKWYWTTTPYGVADPSAWKAPGYPLWVGAIYALLGPVPDNVLLVQALLLGPVTIGLTWILGRRLFNPTVGLVAAFVMAVYPFAWQFETRLLAESLATPLTVLVALLVLERKPSRQRALAVGLLVGVAVLIRPASLYLLPMVAVAWLISVGFRRGVELTALTAATCVLAIVPWTVRNYVVLDGFIPISIQSAALYGTFNDEAANDPRFPYAWRPLNDRDRPLLVREEPLPPAELRSRLQANALEYIAEHPLSVPQAFFWNGISRLWDIRPPGQSLNEVSFQGRSEVVSAIGLGCYYLLLPMALLGLWRARARRGVVLPILALALAASVVFTSIGGTRYRAPLEPLIVIFAASAPRRLGSAATSKPPVQAEGRLAAA